MSTVAVGTSAVPAIVIFAPVSPNGEVRPPGVVMLDFSAAAAKPGTASGASVRPQISSARRRRREITEAS